MDSPINRPLYLSHTVTIRVLLASLFIFTTLQAEESHGKWLPNLSTLSPPRPAAVVRQAPAAPLGDVTIPPLHLAAIEGDVAEVKRLIASGVDLNATETLQGGETALHWAAAGGSRKAVRALLDAGANLEAQDGSGGTAVFFALWAPDPNHLALLELLVDGANVNATADPDGDGDSIAPLHAATAAPENAAGAVELLRRFGADPNSQSGLSRLTPLHYAVLAPSVLGRGFVSLALIENLLDSSIDPYGRETDVNVKALGGLTPLHYAVGPIGSGGDEILVLRWLIASGADVNAVDDYGFSPLEFAEMFHGVSSLAAEYLRVMSAE